MDRSFYLRLSLAAGGLLLARALAGAMPEWAWGLNWIRHLPGLSVVVWTAAGLILLSPWIFRRWTLVRWTKESPPRPAWQVGLAFFIAAWLLPRVATPLLGDGIDRLEATVAGLSELLRGHPAPLDLLVQHGSYRLLSWLSPDADPWLTSWRTWQWTSIAAGGLAAASLWKLASRKAGPQGERWFIFIAIMASGTLVFFFGYVENYVILAAAVYAYLLLFDLAAKRELPVYVLFLAHLVLIGLHYFMLLLVPATLFALYRHQLFRPRPAFTVFLLAAAGVFSLFLLAMIREYYRGLAAIFVAPGDLFGAYHLVGFLNQQILACPALPLLLPLALLFRSPERDPLLAFTGAGSLILLVFFFWLRPVIGSAPDWDLFAMPSLLYTPWLVLKLRAGFKSRPARAAAAGWCLIVFSLACSGPWLSINTREARSVEMFKGFLKWESGHNPWAAATGYIRLGRYLSRSDLEARYPEAKASFLKAIELRPESATFRRQAAAMLGALGEEELSRHHGSESHRLMAEYYLGRERYKEAEAEYRQALLLAPGSTEVLEALVELFEGPLENPAQAELYRRRLQEP